MYQFIRSWIARIILSVAWSTFSCSHTCIDIHPISLNCLSFKRSRSRLRLNFSSHHWVLLLGTVPWMGQLCQKHPSTKTATFAGPNAMSGLPGRSLLWILYRKPLAYRDFLSLISGFELAVGVLRIRSETSLLLDLKVNLCPLIIITLSEIF